MKGYDDFLAAKQRRAQPAGFDVPNESIHTRLFDFQRAIVKWALHRGRAAIFANTGLGKTGMQLSWADNVVRHTGGDVLVLAPLAVAQQTIEEAELLGSTATLCREAADVRPGINVTNYDRAERFDLASFAGVVLDESSILKASDGKTRAFLTQAFARTPYRLCCTATPAPNDTMELGNHSEFLGVLPSVEMLATYFVHDGGETQKWRLKGHAERAFWRWVASWAVVVQKPSDLGFDDSRYDLPALNMVEHILESGQVSEGMLFAMPAQGLVETRVARREGIDKRADWVAEIIASRTRRGEGGPWMVWCDLNAEADAIRERIPDAVEIRGSDDRDEKERRLLDFAHGKIRVLVTKPKIAGLGMNFQVCHKMIFASITDSWEQFFQAIRRCWRFGQQSAVECHLVLTEREHGVLENLKRKERDAERMRAAMVGESMAGFREETHRTSSPYSHPKVEVPEWMISS